MSKSKHSRMQWYLMDLHLHTPASADYQERNVGYLDILRHAEMRGLDIIAFTDHNTVAGYRAMLEEIERLDFLAKLGRATPEEKARLNEYRRLLDKILVLPGFEFTATFGFHILGIFPPDMPLLQIEHILLTLNIPPEVLEKGTTEVGASADVLTAYRIINENGGIVIAAHANSSHGVAMRGFGMRGLGFGGQTRIAFTQDPNLHALEVTDLDKKGRHTTARFFDGSKPEYPRRMRCIQGSDAHRLTTNPKNRRQLGIGDRATEILLPEKSFEAILEVFRGTDFARTRPYWPSKAPFDFVQAAREEGETLVQSFQEGVTRRGGRLYSVVADVCAFANTNGGTVYIGLSANPKEPPIGIENPTEAIATVRAEIERRISPQIPVEIDAQQTQGKWIVRVQVPAGDDPPYAIDDNKIYVRDENETSLAVRDEIVRLVLSNQKLIQEFGKEASQVEERVAAPGKIEPPRTGVEIVGTEVRQGTQYHIMRDLRNGNIVKNVTRSSARKLWRYAITEKETRPVDPNKVIWHGDIGLWKKRVHAGVVRYDLVQRDDGEIRVYYGVTEDGIHGPWLELIGGEGGESEEDEG